MCTVIRILYKQAVLSAGGLRVQSGLKDRLAMAAVDGRALLLRTVKQSALSHNNDIASGDAQHKCAPFKSSHCTLCGAVRGTRTDEGFTTQTQISFLIWSLKLQPVRACVSALHRTEIQNVMNRSVPD